MGSVAALDARLESSYRAAAGTLKGFGLTGRYGPGADIRRLPHSCYRLLLDEALFFISGFMKGPVCRGQVALNVIRDQFWLKLYDSDKDHISNDMYFPPSSQ